ncbi:MAG: holo-ACP synthase [Gemmatimonadaceae bacterium]
MIVGLGIDLVEVARIERLLREKGERAVERIFTPREAEYAKRRAAPAQHFAARFAAKEACYKALSGDDTARAVGWRDIEVVAGPDGRPTLELHGHARRRADQLGVVRALVTLTHTDGVAGAVVVLERD